MTKYYFEKTSKITVEFISHKKKTRVPAGMSIFDSANWIGLPIESTCGALGTCGKCKIRVLEGQSGINEFDVKFFTEKELKEGWRLSCKAIISQDMVCEIPQLLGIPKASIMGFGRHVILNPNVHKVYLDLKPPTMEDQCSDHNRIHDALIENGFDVQLPLDVLKLLPSILRQSKWKITAVVVGQELVKIETGDTSNRCYGIAFDIGTTSVVGTLMDLNTGSSVAISSTLNDQAVFGADVITRISYTMTHKNGIGELQKKIIKTLNTLIKELLNKSNISNHEIYEIVITANATMVHLLLGLDPEAIGVTPFIPVLTDSYKLHADELNLKVLPHAHIFFLPHLGAYVGADIVGGLLASGIVQEDALRLLVDVGTNGEIILGSKNGAVATAAPAGPAFEGAQIKDGMRASEGAIESVRIFEDKIELQVIGDVPPVGLCGSGLLDVVAQLRMIGFLETSGKFVKSNNINTKSSTLFQQRMCTDNDGVQSFVLAWPNETGNNKQIVLTQRDIRELQFAKSAIAGGIEILMKKLNVNTNELKNIYLAGSFGNYINPVSAIVVGLVPPIPIDCIKSIGNSSGEGAKIALTSFRERQKVNKYENIVDYLELSGSTEFSDTFMKLLDFPELNKLNLDMN
jgi:uncharacterized 2Fe-2S/4Fe-4S cluster protein (DUF4445 family)